MVLPNHVKLPTDVELTVPQEITLSTPYFKAVATYMHRKCEDEIKEFMLRRSELEDPRATLKEGAAVTACGVKFLQELKRTCLSEIDHYADCIDKGSAKLYISKCREEQRFADLCVSEKLGIERPKIGYFSKLHVHESAKPKPDSQIRDYKAEAKKILSELPEDYHLREDYRRFREWNAQIFDAA